MVPAGKESGGFPAKGGLGMNLKDSRVAIIGLGVIGGSLGMALRQGNCVAEVTGVDPNSDARHVALDTRAIHRGTADPEEGVREADLVVIATPIGQISTVVSQIKDYLRPGAVVTDVGSSKEEVVRALELMLPPGVHYIGGHPMAGSEQAGILGADRYLLENAFYVLTPTERTTPEALRLVRDMVAAVRAKLIELSPREHDRLVAAVSHLPHLLAVALVNTVADISRTSQEVFALAAGGFRDTTRVATGDPVMWRDICLANGEMILGALDDFRQVLDTMEGLICSGSGDGLLSEFARARETRSSIPARVKGFLPGIFDLVVTVPDRPGMIAEIANILGQRGINIVDIEILRVREGDGGTIRLGFHGEEAVNEALSALRECGIIVKRR